MVEPAPGPRLSARAGDRLASASGRVLVAFLLVTLALIPAAVFLGSDETASAEPGGEPFDLRDDIEARLASPVFPTGYLVEARGADILTRDPLWELLQAKRALLEADTRGALSPQGLEQQALLVDSFDTNSGVAYRGVTTLADAVDRMLGLHPSLGTDLEHASDEQVKFAVAQLLLSPLTAELADALSAKAVSERRVVLGREIDYWTSPALIFIVLADNTALGGGTAGSVGGLAGDDATLNKERFSRGVQEVMRGTQTHYRLWGIAIDQNLEAKDEGTTAGVFIMLTVVAALGVVSLSLRSYWATALTAVGIGVLMLWLKGIIGLVGIKGGLIIDFIVPIAMVSLGVDFAVHAVRRYREERAGGNDPDRALRLAFAGVLGALTLAMLSDGIAFLSNVPSGIEAVVHFGVAAGIAVASAFVVLGIAVPLGVMRLDRAGLGGAPSGRLARVAAIAGGAGVIVPAGASVILTVAVSEAAGAGVLAAVVVAFVSLPLAVGLRRRRPLPERNPAPRTRAAPRGPVPALVIALARRPLRTLAVTFAITAGSLVLASQLEATLDVKDFFISDSDFVVGLDKIDEHVAERSGEGGTIYIRGDLSDPDALRAIAVFMESLRDNPYVGKEIDGEPSIFDRNVVDIIRRITANAAVAAQVIGGPVEDADADGLPDTREQARAVLDHVAANGVRLDDGTTVYTAQDVGAVLDHDPFATAEDVATILVGIPGTRRQQVVAAAEEALRRDLEPLAAEPSISRVGLTGSPFTRNAEITATTSSLRTSLLIAAVGALIALTIAMRSARYAVATVIPIGLVVVWLYAIMYLAGFALNFVTATIGAVSIGVGIDYSIHMTERYREELGRTASRIEALGQAAAGTGTALLASAGSSIVGFAIMGFAPMPLFSSYGTLTAIMIFLALAASLVVLPSLLVLASGHASES